MKSFRIYFYVYITISFSLFSCDIFSASQVPKDVEGVFQDIIKNLKLSQSTLYCSFFDVRKGNSNGTTKSSRSFEQKFSQEYNDFWLNSEDIPEYLQESIVKKNITIQSGSFHIKTFPREKGIVYKYKNYGLDFTGITGIIVGTEVDKSNKTMNIQGILEVSGSYKATMEIRNLRINNKSDNSNCAKLESLENQSDTEKWSIRIKYENPKTTQEMSAEFNESNKEQKKILLESLLQNREPGAKYSYF